MLSGLSVNSKGDALPWVTYPCISFMEKRLRSDMSVFEYGSGNSTLWWAARVARVISCEHDPDWYEKVKVMLPTNVTLTFAELANDAYANAILSQGCAFDIVVIDGRDRVKCAANALSALKEDGIVLWDNSDRAEYSAGFDLLASHGFRRIDFVGMSPLVMFECTTSIFYRSHNCLGI